MSLTTSLVDIENITSNKPRSHFSETKLESLANLILSCGGLIKPLILERMGVDEFKVIEGDFEYYATVKAQEIDEDIEMVRAFILDSDQVEVIQKQALIYKDKEIDLDVNRADSKNKVRDQFPSSNLEERLTQIEIRFEKQLNDLRADRNQEKQQLARQLKQLESRISEPIDALNHLNTLTQEKLAYELQKIRIPSAEKLATQILSARNKKHDKKFENYRDVVKSVKGLGDTRMLTIIDFWSRR